MSIDLIFKGVDGVNEFFFFLVFYFVPFWLSSGSSHVAS